MVHPLAKYRLRTCSLQSSARMTTSIARPSRRCGYACRIQAVQILRASSFPHRTTLNWQPNLQYLAPRSIHLSTWIVFLSMERNPVVVVTTLWLVLMDKQVRLWRWTSSSSTWYLQSSRSYRAWWGKEASSWSWRRVLNARTLMKTQLQKIV